MKITYKYKVGQKVTLSSFQGIDFSRIESFKTLLGKEVTIVERGFIYEDCSFNKRLEKDKIRLEMFYYIDKDPIYSKANKYWGLLTKIPESCLSGCGVWEEVEEHFYSIDGIEIVPFKSRLYHNVIRRYKIEKEKIIEEANYNFVFATEGTCVGLRKNYEISNISLNKNYTKDNYQVKEVKIAREFLTDFEPDEKHGWKPHPRQDCAAYGYENWFSLVIDDCKLGSVMSSIPDNYAEIYVRTATTEFLKQYKFNPFFDSNFKWEIKQWLTRYGVYDKVKELWEKYMPGENKKKSDEIKANEKFLKDARKFVDSLTDKQKEELRKML